MNAKAELAGRVMMMLCDEIKPSSQQVLDVLQSYRVDYSTGMEDFDFDRQINHFLGAKRAEGISPNTIPGYRIYLTMFSNYINKTRRSTQNNNFGLVRLFAAYAPFLPIMSASVAVA